MDEQRLFERFATLAEGRTSLMISHRLGPARFADRVIVMADGRIRETGHHDELKGRDGLYARMFRAQSEWYNEGTTPAGDVAHAAPQVPSLDGVPFTVIPRERSDEGPPGAAAPVSPK